MKNVLDVGRCRVFVSKVHKSAPVSERNIMVCESFKVHANSFTHKVCNRDLMGTRLAANFILTARTSHNAVVRDVDGTNTAKQWQRDMCKIVDFLFLFFFFPFFLGSWGNSRFSSGTGASGDGVW